MAADKQNISVYAGDDVILAVSIKSEASTPLSLAGASFVWTLAPAAGATAILTKTGSSGITITNSAVGAVSISVFHTETATLSGPMWHQLVMTDISGLVTTVMTGTVTFKTRT